MVACIDVMNPAEWLALVALCSCLAGVSVWAVFATAKRDE